MEQTSTISHIVMRRVRVVHALRPFLSGTAIASAVFVVALWGIGREVWVSHIVQNLFAMSNPEAVLAFLVSAFLNTRFVVQVLTILAGGAFVWFLRELSRANIFTRVYA